MLTFWAESQCNCFVTWRVFRPTVSSEDEHFRILALQTTAAEQSAARHRKTEVNSRGKRSGNMLRTVLWWSAFQRLIQYGPFVNQVSSAMLLPNTCNLCCTPSIAAPITIRPNELRSNAKLHGSYRRDDRRTTKADKQCPSVCMGNLSVLALGHPSP